ncbi:MAG: CvpA family protein [Nitrospinae bacterium]|nr:CvpA family protein [Nitrospinota bacterium]
MTTFDTIVGIVLIVSVVYSVFKGMVREIFSLLAYFGGYFAALRFQGDAGAHVQKVLTNHAAARIVSFILIFFCVSILISFIGKGVRALMKSSGGFSGTDRVMGGLIGLLKGLVLVVIVLAPLELFPDLYRSLTKGSMIAPNLEAISKKMRASVAPNNGFLDKFPNISMQGVEEKLNQAKDLGKITDTLKLKAREFSVSDGKPQDEYSKEDKKQLDKMLKSLNKE